MTSKPGQQKIAIHILLPNILQSKDKKTMKFGPLIEYNKRNIFLETSCRKWDGETTISDKNYGKNRYLDNFVFLSPSPS